MNISMDNRTNDKTKDGTDDKRLFWSKRDKKISLDEMIKPRFLMQINPQGVVGIKALEHMNEPGTTTMGGQIPFVMNEGIALANFEFVKVGLKVENNDNVKVKIDVKPYKVAIASQRAEKSFGNKFFRKKELFNECGYKVWRCHLYKDDNGKINQFIDKEAVNALTGENEFYKHLKNWGKRVAKQCVEKGEIPGKIVLNYWDSYIAYMGMLEYWNKLGMTKLPKTVAIPHSLGYRKLTTMLQDLIERSSKELAQKCEKDILMHQNTAKLTVNEVFSKLVSENLVKLLNNSAISFAARILVEREMFSHKEIKGSLNSDIEYKEQLLVGPYVKSFKNYPSATGENVKVINPGIDTIRFGQNENEFMKKHEANAQKRYVERVMQDISPDRRDLPAILVLGRLNFDKNFHGVAKAFIDNESLSERANLVFVINGKDKNDNSNYILEMQKLLKKDPTAKALLLEGFTGSAREQLERMANLLDVDLLKGKYTSISLPDGCDYAGLQRYLGKDSKAVSGLFSFKEPYGLAPFESMISGIPVVASKFSGAKNEIEIAGGEIFDPNSSSEIADALLTTIENLTEKREKQIAFAVSKKWETPAMALDRLLEDNGRTCYSNIDSVFDKKVDVNDKQFVKDGRDLIVATIADEINSAIADGKGSLANCYNKIRKTFGKSI